MALALERRELVEVIGSTIQVSLELKLKFFSAVGIGAQVKALGRGQAKTEVEMPVGFQRKAAIDVKLDAWNIEVQRNVYAQTQQATAQIHVEFDRVHTRLGQRLTLDPGRNTCAIAVVEGDIHVVQRDVAVGVEVLEDLQIGVEHLVERLLDQLHRLAGAGQFVAQIQQQAPAQAGQHLTGIGEALTDEGQIRSHTALEKVLHRAQTQIDAVEHERRVIQQVDQRVLTHFGQVQIGQAEVQREGIARLGVTHQQIQEFGQALIAVFGQGAQDQIADRHVTAQQTGRDRECQIKGADQLDFGLAVDQCNLQRGRQLGIGVGISVKSQ